MYNLGDDLGRATTKDEQALSIHGRHERKLLDYLLDLSAHLLARLDACTRVKVAVRCDDLLARHACDASMTHLISYVIYHM